MPVIHSVQDKSGGRGARFADLLFPRDAAEVLIGEVQERLKLADPRVIDLSGVTFGAGVVEEAFGFLGVLPGHVEGVFQGGFVFESRVLFHGSIVVRFPG